ncbi:methyltransferase domain-containing protein [uncultured Bilophila sp.]|uniref:class I SAM-dependent methyltransferase n=1 Tax=uncultured Bilophila sp. TaxID=529385 RepID=UPI00280B993B|nr:methyltransferase domain-containing protein [uncultured Bilophila sp.]
MVCPSGMPLARSMAAFAPRKGEGLVVELGAGTGTVTRQLLDAGIAPRRLILVEQSPVMARLLRERFPQLTVLEADARWLEDCLPKGVQVDCIVSSLPLLSLSEGVRSQIIRAMFEVLHEGGLLIQYTYSWRKANAFLKDGFRCVGSSQVWHNVPPARVFRFRREGERAFGKGQ